MLILAKTCQNLKKIWYKLQNLSHKSSQKPYEKFHEILGEEEIDDNLANEALEHKFIQECQDKDHGSIPVPANLDHYFLLQRQDGSLVLFKAML